LKKIKGGIEMKYDTLGKELDALSNLLQAFYKTIDALNSLL